MMSARTFGFVGGLVLFVVFAVLSATGRLPPAATESPGLLVLALVVMLFAVARLARTRRTRLLLGGGFTLILLGDAAFALLQNDSSDRAVLPLAIFGLLLNVSGLILLAWGLALGSRAAFRARR